jgi:hypothetical protein
MVGRVRVIPSRNRSKRGFDGRTLQTRRIFPLELFTARASLVISTQRDESADVNAFRFVTQLTVRKSGLRTFEHRDRSLGLTARESRPRGFHERPFRREGQIMIRLVFSCICSNIMSARASRG